MVIDLNGVKGLVGGGGGWSVPAKACDSCKTASATVYCAPDSAFLCLSCDARIHSANKLATRHKRVWLCDVCEQAPAALCVTCDADIHSANPLASRHDRVPVEPFFDSADSLVNSSAFTFTHCSDDDADTASLLLPDPTHDSDPPTFFPQIDDPFLDFAYPKSLNSRIHQYDCDAAAAAADSVVPVQTKPLATSEINCFNVEFCRSKLSSFTYPSQSISQNVSSSSMDVGVVPDGNCNSISDISYPFIAAEPASMIGAVPTAAATATAPAQATQLCGLDREARVMRYREKRKNRKFEKTIRYASRKAYAETRPRIKGRFAKRNETGAESEGLYGAAASGLYLGDCEYGVVPSF